MKLRDLIAMPFWFFAQTLNYLAVCIGGKYTAGLFIEDMRNNVKKLKENGLDKTT